MVLERRGRKSFPGRTGVCLAACHRQLRAQVFGPGVAAHFRLFALVSSARDSGSGHFRCQHAAGLRPERAFLRGETLGPGFVTGLLAGQAGSRWPALRAWPAAWLGDPEGDPVQEALEPECEAFVAGEVHAGGEAHG